MRSRSERFRWWWATALMGAALACAALGSAGWPSAAQAQDYQLRSGRFQLGGGLGFTASPTSFALGFEGAYYFTDNLSINPRMAFGFDDDFTLIMLMADGRYVFDISAAKLRALKPFVGLGLGVTIAAVDGPGDSDAAFTFGLPFGADYFVTSAFSVGTTMQFLFPVDLFDDNFIFHWQVITAKYLF